MNAVDSISLSRGPCLGPCPVYSVTLTRGGSASWHGDYHVEPVGDRDTVIDPAEFERLADLLLDLDFLSWKDVPAPVTCNAHYAIAVTGDGATKTVTQWVGTTPEFRKASEAIDDVARSLGWARPEASTA